MRRPEYEHRAPVTAQAEGQHRNIGTGDIPCRSLSLVWSAYPVIHSGAGEGPCPFEPETPALRGEFVGGGVAPFPAAGRNRRSYMSEPPRACGR